MSGELQLVFDGSQSDIAFANGDFEAGGGLEGAILISVFTHARAPAELTPDLRPDQRGGWWADEPAQPLGSLLWLTNRAKAIPETATRAQGWVRDALQWLINEQIVERLDVAVVLNGKRLEITVTLVRGRATRWSRAWNSALDALYAAGNINLRLTTA